MMTLTEGKHAGGFLVWEVLRDYTRETVIIASGAGKLEPGTVLGKITTGGKYTTLAPAATNGSQNAVGILWTGVDATDADAPGVVVLRGPAIVNRHEIIWPEGGTEAQITAATNALASLGIILR
ncbi:head decoration protein [Thalassobacter stenotrophicus]|uniref:head decoration protein n=1 Tax=Thalassobacter stenotrophicus TaxID=266809 RepID=UPI000D5E63DE|nr:head decoration protein [Thalassobacter stenotrophicus]PVZ47994.1 head decoration protein [Thalassobacter stenotrophicus]